MKSSVRSCIFAILAVICILDVGRATLAGNPMVEVRIVAGGAVLIEGDRYTEIDSLRAKIGELNSRHPKPTLTLRSDDGLTLDEVAPAVVLLQKAGFLRVGFITGPEPINGGNR